MEREITGEDKGWWVVSQQNKIWLPGDKLPYGPAAEFSLSGLSGRPIGEWQGDTVWLINHSRPQNMASLRQLLNEDSGLFRMAGRGVQLAEFYRSHRYCGYCGGEMQHSKTEFACLCTRCHERYYPQIAPCIIVVIRRDDKLLLAQHVRHRNGIYTALAGFAEVGETLEQTVTREVMEESSIRIKNLRYIASQPWPFPQSLMMAFLADYDSGDICIDPEELLDAGWYRYDELPALPPAGTIARRLIEDTVALCRSEYQ
ncbi:MULTISPECIES: NAD(+) diphosphatase [unclassified Tatumella]|uniref:NAD(+) diphosphatase n=1 Tax=unclassified Tatumella TaxID=2649542 RepID=UPI001BB0D665|nr:MULTISPECIES: NAD(+) diphosphatase [unclassified Tatumella]MBS0857456.1 NAD(+) diphosphatase [Tatumella sp. JGM16]MBS0878805.1 NAD(+) diphosphatase [Tatumella sp. JGM82]MBS0892256.1 NAD(+) diphosphatase [Tatumella sp. JGM94]MBS0901127.1 NAD(+) diphosphatase [Tatumella sp. JGM100]MBS0914136.1 NAD(+) diphosphatase [Tatumella sp. JGM91]